MKKLITAVSALVALTVSCSVKENPETAFGGKNKIIFNGSTTAGTRIAVGDKTGSQWPVLWTKGDKLGILSTEPDGDALTFDNASAALYGEGGAQSGVFVLEEDKTVRKTETIYITYPYRTASPISFEGGVPTLSSYVPLEQKARTSGSESIGDYALCWAKTSVTATSTGSDGSVTQSTAPFTLRHEFAYVRLAISGGNYSSYKLAGASIWADGAELAGDFSVNLETNETYTERAREYVVLTVEDPQPLGNGKDLWLVTLPCDLSGKDVWVTVAFKDGEDNVTIPVKVNSGKLKANAVNTINVSVGNNTLSWYEPREKRTLAGGWCYGASNCIMITDMSAPIEIDVRARGFFMGAREPRYVWASNLAYNNPQPSLKIGGTVITTVPSDEILTAERCGTVSDGKMVLDFTGTDLSKMEQGGKLILADKDLHTIWAFTLWYVGEYKDGIISGRYRCGKEVMDRNIGAAKEPFGANRNGYGVQFQWGRPFCFGWSSAGSYKSIQTTCYSLRFSADNADCFLNTTGVGGSWNDWWLGDYRINSTGDRKNDFWGNASFLSSAYDKTIFDPCPKGWTVVSPDVMSEATKNLNWVTNENNVVFQKYQYGDNATDVQYFRSDGFKTNGGGNSANNYAIACSYWSNAPCDTRPEYGWGFTSANQNAFGFPSYRAYGFSVRCMKDEKGR